MIKRCSIPFLLCFTLFALASQAQQIVLMHPADIKMVPVRVQVAPVFSKLPNKLSIVSNNTPTATPAANIVSLNPSRTEVITANRNLAARSVATGAGILGLIAGGRLSNKWAITPKLGVFGGVGWGSNMVNVGIIF